MRWSDVASWSDSLVWTDAENLGSISNTSTTIKNEVPTNVDYTAMASQITGRGAAGGITNDIEITDQLPAGVLLDKILILNSTSNTGTLRGGTATGGTQFFPLISIPPGATIITSDKYIDTAESAFIEGTWNDISIDIYFLYWKIWQS